MVYYSHCARVVQSTTFAKWLAKLADHQARARIQVRIDRLALGNAGDVKAVGESISEIRIDYGPGYRVYFTRRGAVVILLLCAGTKSTQRADIRRAIEIAKKWRD